MSQNKEQRKRVELRLFSDEYHQCPEFTHEMLREYFWSFSEQNPLSAQLKILQTGECTPILCYMSEYWDNNEGMITIRVKDAHIEVKLDAALSYSIIFDIHETQMQNMLQTAHNNIIAARHRIYANYVLRLYVIDVEIAQFFGSPPILPPLLESVTPILCEKVQESCNTPIKPIEGFDVSTYRTLLCKSANANWDHLIREHPAPVSILKRLLHIELNAEEQIQQQQLQAQVNANNEAILAFETFQTANRENIERYEKLITQKACDNQVLQLLQGSTAHFKYNETPSAEVCKLLRDYLPQNHILTKMFLELQEDDNQRTKIARREK